MKKIHAKILIPILATLVLGFAGGLVVSFYYVPTFLYDFLDGGMNSALTPIEQCDGGAIAQKIAQKIYPDGYFDSNEDLFFHSSERVVYKWRDDVGKPYFEYLADGGFEIKFPGDYEQVLTLLDGQFITEMEKSNFVPSLTNMIPFYRYPGGERGRKIGFTSVGGTRYLIGLYDESYPDPNDFRGDDELDVESELAMIDGVVLRVRCGLPEEEVVAVYGDYAKTDDYHDLPPETVVSYDEFAVSEDEGLIQIKLEYPGTPPWGFGSQLWHQDDDGLRKISDDLPQPSCSDVEKLMISRSFHCFDGNIKEFRMSK